MFASDTNGIESPTCLLIVWLTIIADPASVSTFECQVGFFKTEAHYIASACNHVRPGDTDSGPNPQGRTRSVETRTMISLFRSARVPGHFSWDNCNRRVATADSIDTI
jgi:hypothetical protein